MNKFDSKVRDRINQSRLTLNEEEAEAFKDALAGVAFWLDCSPHERDEKSGLWMAKFIRMIEPRIGVPLTEDNVE